MTIPGDQVLVYNRDIDNCYQIEYHIYMHALEMKLTFVSTYALLPLVLLFSQMYYIILRITLYIRTLMWPRSTILFRGSLACLNWMIHRLLHYRPSHYKSRWWNVSHHNRFLIFFILKMIKQKLSNLEQYKTIINN